MRRVRSPRPASRLPTREARRLLTPDPDCSEAELDVFVRELAREGGWITYHVLRPERMPAGFPDRVLLHPLRGILAFVELKRALGPRGGVTRSSGAGVLPDAEVRAWLEGVARVRWVVSALWRPGDAARIREWLGGALEEPPGLIATGSDVLRAQQGAGAAEGEGPGTSPGPSSG